jgi:hypothetical protein
MHFHLPKPLHGWREFAGEVGIIVVGVLIALGAEQVVERIHLQTQTHHARESLKAEIADSYTDAFERRLVHTCLNGQIDRMESAILGSSSVMNPMPLYKQGSLGLFVYRAPSRPWGDSVWQNVRAEDVFANLPEDTRTYLTSYYTQLAYMQRMNDEEDNVVGTAMVLGKPVPLDASVKANLIEQLENDRRRNDLMDLIASQMMHAADEVDAKPDAKTLTEMGRQSGTVKFCNAHGLPVSAASNS